MEYSSMFSLQTLMRH